MKASALLLSYTIQYLVADLPPRNVCYNSVHFPRVDSPHLAYLFFIRHKPGGFLLIVALTRHKARFALSQTTRLLHLSAATHRRICAIRLA